MTREEMNAFCASLRAVTHVVQWGGADVWKVGDKVFAMVRDEGVTFKASPMAFEILQAEAGIRPAPYMASRGLKWLQHYGPPGGLSDDSLRDHLQASYDMVIAGLSKKKQAEVRN
ncbi:MmcQ/YjbR family DNA-binding protein [Pseudorhodobacter ferrugineus]|uniref:MmcQ/YjbR family DNA-binding protein n=1 Tax=Pseudorhodobacter ferrugineus TaxID=77008 RepID=UPI0003B79C4F|nr:MmcQ/YjbR family DNA-binding protein [Pseudorhodobacter ferrugineus]